MALFCTGLRFVSNRSLDTKAYRYNLKGVIRLIKCIYFCPASCTIYNTTELAPPCYKSGKVQLCLETIVVTTPT